MRTLTLALSLSFATVTAVASLVSKDDGYYAPLVPRSTPSCGQCHRATPGAPAGSTPIAVSVAPTTRLLTSSQSVSITVTATGGQGGSKGGFAADATAGTFTAGANTKIQAAGQAITHSNPNARTWTFGYVAPATPGLIDLFTVVNTVDGDGNNSSGDWWGFHGADQTATQSTPVRLFVNASGVTAIGTACAGSYGNVPLLGSATLPTVGNQAFALEVHGAAPSAPVALILGATPVPPLDLSAIGMPGCTLWVETLTTISGQTRAGNAQRGEGSATLALPIPANPWLVGKGLQAQAAILDAAAPRSLPVTMTNGLGFVFQ